MELSPWPYNYSYSSRYFPLAESEARAQNLSWLTKESADAASVKEQSIPDSLPETDQPIVGVCEQTGRLFRITTEEIKRLRKLNAPLPRIADDLRMGERSLRCGGLVLKLRKSQKTGAPLLTAYDEQVAPIIWEKDEFDREFV